MDAFIFFQFLFPILFLLGPLVLGFFFGRHMEKKHYASIIERESDTSLPLVFHERLPPLLPARETCLVAGSVVVSADYFKRFIASLRSLVGGRLNTYEALLDRGRREAILRLQAQAKAAGASQVFNIKMETSAIGGRYGQSGLSCVEVLAYGTALIEPRS
ncbi:MAG: YbjQ family protein [Saccharospirillum sp.]|nr:YbjQ family protein [Saccharospirillum sp.]